MPPHYKPISCPVLLCGMLFTPGLMGMTGREERPDVAYGVFNSSPVNIVALNVLSYSSVIVSVLDPVYR